MDVVDLDALDSGSSLSELESLSTVSGIVLSSATSRCLPFAFSDMGGAGSLSIIELWPCEVDELKATTRLFDYRKGVICDALA